MLLFHIETGLQEEGKPDPSDEGDSIGDIEEEQGKEKDGESAAAGRKKDGALVTAQPDNNEEAPEGEDASVGDSMFRRTGTHQKQVGSSGSTGGMGASKTGVVPKLGTEGDDTVGAAATANLLPDGQEGAITERVETKKPKGRVVPGSLLLTSVSASDLPDTEKGMFSKQVNQIKHVFQIGERSMRYKQMNQAFGFIRTIYLRSWV